MHFDKILVTTDFSEISYSAFELPAYSSKMDGSEVILVTIVDDWQVPEVFLRQIPNPESVTQYRKDIQEKSEARLAEIAEKYFHGQKVVTKVILSEKAVADEICDLAEKEQVELIVIASQGKGTFGKLLLGSTVQKVISHASCPVMVVPKKK